MAPPIVAPTIVRTRAGDRNGRGVAGAVVMGRALVDRLQRSPTMIGRPESPPPAGWRAALSAALPLLRLLSTHYDRLLSAGVVPVTAMARCAAALATLPVVARHHPEAAIVWFDAHADSNTPDSTTTGYLGGWS